MIISEDKCSRQISRTSINHDEFAIFCTKCPVIDVVTGTSFPRNSRYSSNNDLVEPTTETLDCKESKPRDSSQHYSSNDSLKCLEKRESTSNLSLSFSNSDNFDILKADHYSSLRCDRSVSNLSDNDPFYPFNESNEENLNPDASKEYHFTREVHQGCSTSKTEQNENVSDIYRNYTTHFSRLLEDSRNSVNQIQLHQKGPTTTVHSKYELDHTNVSKLENNAPCRGIEQSLPNAAIQGLTETEGKQILVVNYQFAKSQRTEPTKERKFSYDSKLKRRNSKTSLHKKQPSKTSIEPAKQEQMIEKEKEDTEKKIKETQRVSIQGGSHSIRYVPWDCYTSSNYLQGSSQIKCHPPPGSLVDESMFSQISSSLYIDPPYFGCNEDCTGTKMSGIPDGSHLDRPASFASPVEITMENVSTVPLLDNYDMFQDILAETKAVATSSKIPTDKSSCGCHPQLHYVNIQPSNRHSLVGFGRQGIPIRSDEYYLRKMPEIDHLHQQPRAFADCSCDAKQNGFENIHECPKFGIRSPALESIDRRRYLDESYCNSCCAKHNSFENMRAYQRFGTRTQPVESLDRRTTLDETNINRNPMKENCNCKTPLSDSVRDEKPADDRLGKENPVVEKNIEKKKRRCTICKSGKVDKDELSRHPEHKKEQPGFDPHKVDHTPENYTTTTNPCKCQSFPRLSHQILDESPTRFKPYQVHRGFIEAEKECPCQTPLSRLPKTVGCVTEHPNLPQNTIDAGRNITIQIIPNCGHARCFSGQNFSVKDGTRSTKPMEQVYPLKSFTSVTNAGPKHCNEYTCSKPENVHSMHNTCSQDVIMNAPSYKRDQYRQYELKERQFNRWWSCSWRRKRQEYPYHRSQHRRITQDSCTNTCQNATESAECQRVVPVSDNYRLMSIQECQRVLPMQNYSNGQYLKYIHRMNKGLFRDLFATPCPSASLACNKSCARKIKGAPFPLCAGSSPAGPPLGFPLKPTQVNQCSQYEPDSNPLQYSMKEVKQCSSTTDPNKVICECLKYLTKKISRVENCETEDEIEDSCCCCQTYSYNNSCCCQRQVRCCCCCPEIRVVKQKVVEEKKVTPCCTRCRSVEAKQSCKHCGTTVSSQCFRKVETVCTNTEAAPKTPKVEMRKKRVRCCKPRCCQCCKPRPICQYEQCCQSGPQMHCCKMPCCPCEHMMYSCRCQYNSPFYQTKMKCPFTEEEGYIEVLSMEDTKAIAVETKNVSTGESVNKSVKSCQYTETKSEVKSTNTILIGRDAPEGSDEIIKTITLDLCNLGGKTFSKFGVPSQYYPWSSNTFLPDMPNEIYRFVGADSSITGRIPDPTPCLKPEVLSVNSSKSNIQNVDLVQVKHKLNLPGATGDIKENLTSKRYLSTICEAIFGSEANTNPANRQTILDLNWVSDNKSTAASDTTFSKSIKSNTWIDKSRSSKSDTSPITNKKDKFRLEGESTEVDACSNKDKNQRIEEKQSEENKTLKNKAEFKPVYKKYLGKIQPKKEQVIPKTYNVKANYTSKPFTTRTGLMSFVPSFRDTFKGNGQTSKPKPSQLSIKRPNTKNWRRERELENEKFQTKNSNEKSATLKNESKVKESKSKSPTTDVIGLNTQMATSPNELVGKYAITNLRKTSNFSEKEEKSLQASVAVEVNMTNKLQTKESSTSDHINVKNLDELYKKSSSNLNFKKFDNEIYSFYDKCFKTPEKSQVEIPVPYFKTNVSNIVKSLETRRSSVNFSPSRPFLCSLLGSQTNCLENHNDSMLRDYLYNDSNSVCDFSYNDNDYKKLYGKSFMRSFEQSDIQIPTKIMSKTDLISLK